MTLGTFVIHEGGQNVNIHRSLEEVSSNSQVNFEGSESSTQGRAVVVVRIAKDLVFRVQCEHMAASCGFQGRTLKDDESLSVGE